MKLIWASWELQPRSCLSSWYIKFFTVDTFTCDRSGFGK